MNRLIALLVLPLALTTGCSSGSGGAAVQKGGSATAQGGVSAQTAEVDGKDTLKFGPSVVNAKVGTLALTFRNTGQVPHNLVFDDSALGKTGTVDGGQQQVLTLTLDKPGTFRFQCTFHPGMTGQVVVS